MSSAADGTRMPVRVRDLKLVQGGAPDDVVREHGLVARCAYHCFSRRGCENKCARESGHKGSCVCGDQACIDVCFVKPAPAPLVVLSPEEKRQQIVRARWRWGAFSAGYTIAQTWACTLAASVLSAPLFIAFVITSLIGGAFPFVRFFVELCSKADE